MTEPTDAELDELRQANSGRLNFVTFSEFRTIARAALAKWGAPPAVAGEPVATLHCNQDCYVWARATEAGKLLRFEEPMNLYTTPQPTQAQAGAVPLTDEEVLDAFCRTPGIHQFVQAFWAGVRFAEQHHGIKGGQHGADTRSN